MNGQRHQPWTGVAIRASGGAALGLAWVCGHALWRLHATDPSSAVMFLLAMITFLAGSAGSAMLIVGPHLLDEVEVSRRWARRPIPHDPNPDDDNGIQY